MKCDQTAMGRMWNRKVHYVNCQGMVRQVLFVSFVESVALEVFLLLLTMIMQAVRGGTK